MNKSVLLLVFSTIILQISSGQSLKTYSGDYELDGYLLNEIPFYMLNGEATYQYYENDDYDRIRKGKFTYSGEVSENGVSLELNVNGYYKENLKNGLWQSNLYINNQGQKIKTVCYTNYSKGIPNGPWEIDAYTRGQKETASLHFNNNLITGNFGIKMSNIKMNGKCNLDGYLDGVIELVEGEVEMIMNYDNGFLINYIVRDLSTGEIQKRVNADPDQLKAYVKIKKHIADGNIDALEDIPFKVRSDYNPALHNKFNEYFTMLNMGDTFPGDLKYNSNGYEWSGFKIKLLDEQETRAEKLEKERIEKEQQAKLEAERIERERIEKERQAKLEAERIERERIANEERIAKEKSEKANLLYNELLQDYNNSSKKIESKFKVIDPIATAALGVDTYKTKRKVLYRSYRTLLDDYINQVNNVKEVDEKNIIMSKVISLCKRVEELFDKKNKDLEKALKKANSSSQIEKIIMKI